MLWVSILAIGALVNAFYIMIELRVPPRQLGSSMVIILTCGNLCASLAPNFGYLPPPLPLYVQLLLCMMIVLTVLKLPEAGLHLPKVAVE